MKNIYSFNKKTLNSFLNTYFNIKNKHSDINSFQEENFVFHFNVSTGLFSFHSSTLEIEHFNTQINQLNSSFFVSDLKDYFSNSLLFNVDTFSTFLKRKYHKTNTINATLNSISLNYLN